MVRMENLVSRGPAEPNRIDVMSRLLPTAKYKLDDDPNREFRKLLNYHNQKIIFYVLLASMFPFPLPIKG